MEEKRKGGKGDEDGEMEIDVESREEEGRKKWTENRQLVELRGITGLANQRDGYSRLHRPMMQ